MLVEKDVAVLLPFSTINLCEKACSFYTYLKSKYRNGPNVEYDLRQYLSLSVTNFKALCRSKEAQSSL
jgi:hypothetical protein